MSWRVVLVALLGFLHSLLLRRDWPARFLAATNESGDSFCRGPMVGELTEGLGWVG